MPLKKQPPPPEDRQTSASLEELLGPLNDVERRNAPQRVYLAGEVQLLQRGPRVSIVGSRKASADGLKRAARLALVLSERGVIIVSGLAEGIDTATHRSAIDAGGFTIAVLGTPLNQVFPRANRELQDVIMRRHLAISQFSDGYPVRRTNFPQRNRTMALISHASVIIEAGNTSGSLSQGFEALRLGRPLFIAKSVFGQPGLTWPSEMLRYGAQVLEAPEDLFDFLPLDVGGPLAGAAF